jgi:hypothetical protein
MHTSQLPSAPLWSGRPTVSQPRIGRPLYVAVVVASAALVAVAVVIAPPEQEPGPARGGTSPSATEAGPPLVSDTFGVHHKIP